MDDSARIQLEHDLQSRKHSIAETWYLAVAHTSFAPFTPAELRQRLVELTGQAIALLFTEPFEPDRAQQIGVALAGLHYTQPEALGSTQGVLARELLCVLSAEQVLAVVPHLGALLEGVAIGFGRQTTRIQLLEQDSIRSALVSELRAAERELREARDHLEEQVEKRTEELRASEERLRDLLENIEVVVATVDQEGVVTYVSPPVARLFGRAPGEVVGRPLHEFVYTPDLPRIQEQFEQVRAGQGQACEFRFLTGSGELRCVHASVRPALERGRASAAHLVLTDVTERRRAGKELQESEERWRSLVTNAPDAIYTVDPEGRLLFVNHLPPESGLTPQGVLGRSICDQVVPVHREIVEAALRHVFTTGTSTKYEAAVQQAGVPLCGTLPTLDPYGAMARW